MVWASSWGNDCNNLTYSSSYSDDGVSIMHPYTERALIKVLERIAKALEKSNEKE